MSGRLKEGRKEVYDVMVYRMNLSSEEIYERLDVSFHESDTQIWSKRTRTYNIKSISGLLLLETE